MSERGPGPAPGATRFHRIQVLGSRSDGIIRARAFHRSTQQDVLVYIASDPSFYDELERITGVLLGSKNPEIGTVIDRESGARKESWRALITTWHNDAHSLDDLLKNAVQAPASAVPHRVNLIEVLRDVAMQLSSMHSAGMVHRDLSSSNVLVDSAGRAHLVDFETSGPARIGDKTGDEVWTFTPTYSHINRAQAMAEGDYDTDDEYRWDRYALGRLMQNIRSTADPYVYRELNYYNQRAIQMLSGLLMGRDLAPGEAALGLPTDFYRDEEYQTLEPFISALSRLLGESADGGLVPELSPIQPSVVEIGAVVPAPFTPRVRALIDSDRMQALGSFQQLGLISFMWPSATHTRLEHGIGTFATACEALRNLMEDPQSPIMRIMGTEYAQRTLLAATLLHDIGHFPLAHDLEEALPSAFHHESRSIEFIQDGSIAEILSAGLPHTASEGKTGDFETGWAVYPADVAAVVSGAPISGGILTSWMVSLLHSILSGALDVDKIDYLVRDSQRLHVAAGAGIDVPRVLSSLTVAVVNIPGRTSRYPTTVALRLAVRSKGARPAELVGRVRSHMFGVVYWHHSYRAIKAMMHWICWEAVVSSGAESDVLKRASALSRLLNEALGDAHNSALFDSSSMLPGFERMWESAPRIPHREGSVLRFLASHGGDTAGELVDLLENKSWYRPLFTAYHHENLAVSGEGDERSRELWTSVARLQSASTESWILTRYRWAKRLQERLIGALYTTQPPVTAIVRRGDLLNEVSKRSAQQLVLIDTVQVSKSKETPLYLVQTERRSSRRGSTTSPIPVRKSYDQQMLEKEFVVANGAIRILVHPKFADLVERTLDYDVLFDHLLVSLSEV